MTYGYIQISVPCFSNLHVTQQRWKQNFLSWSLKSLRSTQLISKSIFFLNREKCEMKSDCWARWKSSKLKGCIILSNTSHQVHSQLRKAPFKPSHWTPTESSPKVQRDTKAVLSAWMAFLWVLFLFQPNVLGYYTLDKLSDSYLEKPTCLILGKKIKRLFYRMRTIQLQWKVERIRFTLHSSPWPCFYTPRQTVQLTPCMECWHLEWPQHSHNMKMTILLQLFPAFVFQLKTGTGYLLLWINGYGCL